MKNSKIKPNKKRAFTLWAIIMVIILHTLTSCSNTAQVTALETPALNTPDASIPTTPTTQAETQAAAKSEIQPAELKQSYPDADFFIDVTTYLSLATNTQSTTAQANQIKVTLDGAAIHFPDQQPVIVDGRTLVPVRGPFEAMGFTVTWDAQRQQATISNADYTMIITIGSNVFTVNNVKYELDVPAQLINGRTMVPLRKPLEAVGYSIDWDAKSSTVIIESPEEEQDEPIPDYIRLMFNGEWINTQDAGIILTNGAPMIPIEIIPLSVSTAGKTQILDHAVFNGMGFEVRSSIAYKREAGALIETSLTLIIINDDFRTGFTLAPDGTVGNQKLKEDGSYGDYINKPYRKGNTVYAPLAEIFEGRKWTVQYDSAQNAVIVTSKPIVDESKPKATRTPDPAKNIKDYSTATIQDLLNAGYTKEVALDIFEYQLFLETNRVREENGKVELQWNEALARASRNHAKDQVVNNTLSHTGSDGSKSNERARREGWYYSVGENGIVAGLSSSTPKSLIERWMNSSGHKNQMLGTAHRYFGAGMWYDDQGNSKAYTLHSAGKQ